MDFGHVRTVKLFIYCTTRDQHDTGYHLPIWEQKVFSLSRKDVAKYWSMLPLSVEEIRWVPSDFEELGSLEEPKRNSGRSMF